MTLHVLIIEDSDDDAALIIRELLRAGHDLAWERVVDAPGLREALMRATWDVVLSDWSLPGFSGRAALAEATAIRPEVPFIIVTGTIDEATAVDAMRAGARDVIVKSRLARLVPAVERETREVRERARTRAALKLDSSASSSRASSVSFSATPMARSSRRTTRFAECSATRRATCA